MDASVPGAKASELGRWLHRARAEAGLTQEELAARSGVAVRTIGDLERDRTRRPYARSIRLLADALNVPFPGQAAAALPGERASGAANSLTVVPRQLPGPVRHFAGRRAELELLTGLLGEASTVPDPVLITSIGGTAGVGKTALAVHWAHQVAHRFPDGQLYVNLRGFDPSGRPTEAVEAVRVLLDALGVPAGQIPAGLDAMTGLYRSLLAGRQMLILLDNARDGGQLRPLLPGGPGCLVVVTSRSELTGLTATDGAWPVRLGLLTDTEAGDLLTGRLGAARLAAEPAAADQLIRLCGGLPLALAITAARASARPEIPLAALAAELHDTPHRLDALDTGDSAASIRAVFSWSVQGLSPAARDMFGQLGLHPGPDITIPAAASLAGVTLPRARTALCELAAAHLATEHAKGRFAFHDLLRAYAAEQAGGISEPERRAAIHRIHDHYLHTAYAASFLIHPYRDPIARPLARPTVRPEKLDGQQQAMEWFRAEVHVLLAVIRLEVGDGEFSEHAWQLPWAVAMFLNWDGYWHELAATQEVALAAACRAGDHAGQAEAHRFLGLACVRFGALDEGTSHLAAVLELGQRLGSITLQARAHLELSRVANARNQSSDALNHAEQALLLYQAQEYRPGQASALNAAGWSCVLLGRHQEALRHCEQALALNRELGNRSGGAATLHSLGYSHHRLGNHVQAIRCYQQSIEAFGDADDAHHRAQAFTDLGDALREYGDDIAAHRAWEEALTILEVLEHPDAEEVRRRLAWLQ
jgi:tetratricopeptide (TPR) repeat protein/transcriptional regulator with XRE-family HTH domain